jgi:hypothetical protein
MSKENKSTSFHTRVEDWVNETLNNLGEYEEKSKTVVSGTSSTSSTHKRRAPATSSHNISNSKTRAEHRYPSCGSSSSDPIVRRAASTRQDMLHTWLVERLDRTREHESIGTTGKDGAEEKDTHEDLQDPLCPLCKHSIGASTDQHLLKCMFAHEEMLRLQAM